MTGISSYTTLELHVYGETFAQLESSAIIEADAFFGQERYQLTMKVRVAGRPSQYTYVGHVEAHRLLTDEEREELYGNG